MAGRRDDSTGDRTPATPADDGGHPAVRRGAAHTAGLAAGLLLAVGATVAVLATDDALRLRIGLLAACWAFLVAAFLAGGRRADQLAAQSREAELRHAYEIELEREVAARAEYERDLEQRLRREAEPGMRSELADLRAGLSGLSGLRADLAALGELRADLGRLRGELAEQLSGELLIERMVMRAQAVRVPGEGATDDGRTLDGVAASGGPGSGSWERHTTVARWTGDGEPAGPSAVPSPARSLRPIPNRTPPRPPAPGDESTLRLARLDDDPAVDAAPGGTSPSDVSEGGTSWGGTPSVEDRPTGAPPVAVPSVAVPSVAVPSVAVPPMGASSVADPVVAEAERSVPAPGPDLPAEVVGPAVVASAQPPQEPVVLRPEPPVVVPSGPSPSPPAAQRPVPRSRHRVGLEGVSGESGAAPRRHRRAAETDDVLPVAGPPAAAVPAAGESGPSVAGSHGWADPEPAGWGAAVPPEPAAPVTPEPAAPVTPEPPASSEPDGAEARPGPVPGAAPEAAGHARLEQILAESGVTPTEGRRRRRYRDEGDPQPADDVLARVLGHAPPG